MARGGKSPKQATWAICLVLYLIALANHFGVIHMRSDLASWCWILGYAILLIAVQMRGL